MSSNFVEMFCRETENFQKNFKEINERDNTKLINCLSNILIDKEAIRNNYKIIIDFLIKNHKKIYTIFKDEEKKKNSNLLFNIDKIKDILKNMTTLNNDFPALNEYYNGLFKIIYKKKIYGINYEKIKLPIKEQIEKELNNLKRIYINYSFDSINEDNNFNLVYNCLSNFKNESFEMKEIFNEIIFILCHYYPFFSELQRKNLRIKYNNYFENSIIRDSILFPFEIHSFPKKEIKEEDLVFFLKEYGFRISKEEIFILYYYYTFTNKLYSNKFKSKLKFFLMIMIELNKLEGDSFFNHFYIIKKLYETEKIISIDNNLIIKLNDIFESEDIYLYKTIFKTFLTDFYLIPKKLSLLEKDNLTFIFGFIELFYINKTITPEKLRNNLINLEKTILKTFKESIKIENNIYESIKIDKSIKTIFDEIQKKIRRIESYGFKIKLYPFGSVTQGLGSSTSDLDTYLEIKGNKYTIDDNKINILNNISNLIKQLDPQMTNYITNRLCLFSFTYKNLKIDINYYGICSVLGSNFLLKYSLIDARFPILAIFIKDILNKYNIKNNEKSKIYLNSFSWMCILLCFLQDIIYPPILPKFNNEEYIIKKNISVGGGVKGKPKKDFVDVFNSEKIEEFYFYDLKKINKLIQEKKFISQNKMTVSEIFLLFCKFIGFYFNYKNICVNCSFEFQGFVSKNIMTLTNLKGDLKGRKFYNNVFLKNNSKNIFIREPFDHTYNPAKEVSIENMDKIIDTFKLIYKNIIENGIV